MTQAPAQAPGTFKSQPWILYDTVASFDYTLGSATNALGATVPAISAAGEMQWFNAPGRTKGTMPWYTNMDQQGRLSYGLEVWQVYLKVMFPAMPLMPSYDADAPASAPTILNVPPTTRLAEAILNYSVLSLELGQEQQFEFPAGSFGAGGGIVDSSSQTSMVQNMQQVAGNVLKLPEPIEMPNTQVLTARMRISTDVQGLIGRVGALGVGAPLATQSYTVANATTNPLTLPPYAIQLGLVGRRVKNTQYGQLT